MRTSVRKTIVSLLALVATASALAVGSPRPADADGALETGRALPAVPASTQPTRVALDGAWVYVALQSSAPATTPSGIYRTAADGSGGWAAVNDPGTGSIATTLSLLVVRDGYLLVVPSQDVTTPCTDYRLIGPALSRSLTSCGAPTLIDGGRIERSDDWPGPWDLETVAGTLLRTFDHPTVVAGNRGWYVDDSQHLVSIDVTTGSALPSEPLPYACQPYSPLGYAAGYVLLWCSAPAVLDVDGDLPPWPLAPLSWALGNGFAAGSDGASGDLTIEDLGQGKATRHFAVSNPARWSPDAGGGPEVAFLTPDLQVAMADLGTLAPRSTTVEDVTAPIATLDSYPPAVLPPDPGSSTTHLGYYWSGADPDHPGAVSFEIQRAYAAVGESRTWQPVFANTELTSLFADVKSNYVYCLRVRARDWAGNVSVWTPGRCSLVDDQKPVVRWTMKNWSGSFPALADHPVGISWKGTDSGGLDRSTVSQRVARPGQSGTTWTIPTKWQSLSSTSTSARYLAGDTVCFRVWMHDKAGNVSSAAETGIRCTSIPYDDRSFWISGTARRASSLAMLGGTYTRLPDARSWMQRSGLRIRAVDVRITSTTFDDPPRIYVGRHEIPAFYAFNDGRRWWLSFPLSKTVDGTVRIRGNEFRAVGIDAIAIEH